jgi:protein TonB
VFQSRLVPALPLIERLRTGAGRRALGFGVAILIEALILALLLTLGREAHPGVQEEAPTEVTFIAPEVSEKAPEPERRAEARPETQRPQPEQPRPPQPAPAPVTPATPAPTPIIPMQFSLAPSAPHAPPAPPARPLYGPADHRSAAFGDTERVGTAPNGEPLYAAEWYREPDDHMLGTYLSTSNGPGWGLIACRTAPDYRVEDCVPLEEYPQGSQINRSVLAAAWEFRVRPPRRGGQPLVGSWVRIRIDYGIGRHRRD